MDSLTSARKNKAERQNSLGVPRQLSLNMEYDVSFAMKIQKDPKRSSALLCSSCSSVFLEQVNVFFVFHGCLSTRTSLLKP